MRSDIQKGVLMTLGYAFIMSLSTISAKQTQTIIGVPILLFWQSLLCCLFLLPQMRGAILHKFSKIWKILILRSFCGFFALLCYYWTLNNIPIVEASLLRSSAPLCVPLVILLIYHKSIPSRRWAPLIIGFVGVFIVMHPNLQELNFWHIVGFMSALGLALSMVTTRMLSDYISTKEALFIYFFFSTIFSFGLILVKGSSVVVPMNSWGWILAVTITLYLGMYLYTLAYTYAPASIVSPVSYISIAFNALWGWWFWHHTPDIYTWVGAFFIILSIWLTTKTSNN